MIRHLLNAALALPLAIAMRNSFHRSLYQSLACCIVAGCIAFVVACKPRVREGMTRAKPSPATAPARASLPRAFTVEWTWPATGDPALQSILRLDNDVFATTDDGFYHADLPDRHWKRIRGMPMRPGGSFANEPLEAVELYYSTFPPSEGFPRHPQPPRTAQIWRSDDRGRSWRHVADRTELSYMLLLEDGSLYAIANGRVLRSKDRGASWEDITHDQRGTPLSLSEDGRRPGQIVVRADGGMRLLDWYAPDAGYGWKYTLGADIRVTPASFMVRQASTTWFGLGAKASLQSYFPDEYRNEVQVFGLLAVTGRDEWIFTSGKPMVVPVEVRSLSHGDAVHLVDYEDARRCWSLNVMGDDTSSATRTQLGLPAKGTRDVVAVDPEHPYRRTIDLSEIQPLLNRPGRYRAKLVYNSYGIAGSSHGEWPGMFEGADFGIEIVPPGK